MKMALKDASLTPKNIQYINAHATSTPVGDGLETAALKTLFQEDAKNVWISSTKSMSGHLLGAAGAFESAMCIQSLIHNVVPPTINLVKPSADCDLDYVPMKAREGRLENVMNNSFGFGGTNACMIFSRFKE
jgi:3-oxoacyl-[acyl-carrier-protein] synthase II